MIYIIEQTAKDSGIYKCLKNFYPGLVAVTDIATVTVCWRIITLHQLKLISKTPAIDNYLSESLENLSVVLVDLSYLHSFEVHITHGTSAEQYFVGSPWNFIKY